ncbi:MAG: exodeoxyribonuclease VII small subunit [Candidatus Sumerlaeaceae bacterium]
MSQKPKPPQPPPAATPQANPTDEIACMPIEKCFEELETIVEKLENQQTSLEQSIALFERGMKLSKRCSTELTRIEKKIHVILENSKGDVELKPFEADTESE